MLNQDFASFFTLAVISLIATGFVHNGIRYRLLEGNDGFFAEWIAAWLGGWLGSPVLGHWFVGAKVGSVYIVPALLGGLVGAFAPTALLKARAMTQSPAAFGIHETPRDKAA